MKNLCCVLAVFVFMFAATAFAGTGTIPYFLAYEIPSEKVYTEIIISNTSSVAQTVTIKFIGFDGIPISSQQFYQRVASTTQTNVGTFNADGEAILEIPATSVGGIQLIPGSVTQDGYARITKISTEKNVSAQTMVTSLNPATGAVNYKYALPVNGGALF